MVQRGRRKDGDMDPGADVSLDIRSIMKDVERFSSAHMTWKEKKELENKRVVTLGGKPPKKQRLPLSVAKVPMKKQKEREKKLLQENQLFGKFEGIARMQGVKKKDKRRSNGDRGLRATEGYFRNGVLEVKHLMNSGQSSGDRIPGRLNINIGGSQDGGGGKQKGRGGGGKKKGKKKGKGGKRR
uniref:Uncharacterized protein n=1 Tax=Kalanchoe fedtschenkoi TaxID=63787 RepID=A0A7N0ZQ65_KALFE